MSDNEVSINYSIAALRTKNSYKTEKNLLNEICVAFYVLCLTSFIKL